MRSAWAWRRRILVAAAAALPPVLLHSPLSPHLCTHSIKPSPSGRASTVSLRMSRPRHFSVSISSNNSPLFRQKIPNGRKKKKGRKGCWTPRREGGVRGAVVVRSGGNGEREAPQLLDSCYESRKTYPRTTAELFLSSEFDNSRLNRPILKP